MSTPQVIFGTSATENPVPKVEEPLVTYPGRSLQGDLSFSLDESLLSKHILLLGGSGCGKTNAFLYAISALRCQMSEHDVAIIFDTKGEFHSEFSRPGDMVIGNSPAFRPLSNTWNLFDEILADGSGEAEITLNAREISSALFYGRGSSSQPFFCNAARDIFRGVLLHFIRSAEQMPDVWGKRLNNQDLVSALQGYQVEQYIQIFKKYQDLRGLLSYFGDGTSNQALGVFGELNSMISEYFVGIFAGHNPQRSISMRQAVRQKGGKAIFIEYDLSVGETLTPIYRLLLDQALKEALSRQKSGGRVFVFADEFKLLPKLQHIDDALNFGRGLGIKVMAGIQSIDQLYDIYGREKGAVIASGFGSMFAFHTNDSSSREYVTKRYGPNYVAYSYHSHHRNSRVYDERSGNVAEEWDQIRLGVGQALIGLGYEAPFLFQFDEYRK